MPIFRTLEFHDELSVEAGIRLHNRYQADHGKIGSYSGGAEWLKQVRVKRTGRNGDVKIEGFRATQERESGFQGRLRIPAQPSYEKFSAKGHIPILQTTSV